MRRKDEKGDTGVRLTRAILAAIQSALTAALAGEGFEGGDFNGQERGDFERALEWAESRRRDMESTL